MLDKTAPLRMAVLAKPVAKPEARASKARSDHLAHRQYSSDQIQQRTVEVVLGHQHLFPAIQAEVVDGSTGIRPVRRRGSQSAMGEILPLGAITSLGGVHHAALHGAVPLDPGRNDPHQPILRLSVRWGERQTRKGPAKTRVTLHETRG